MSRTPTYYHGVVSSERLAVATGDGVRVILYHVEHKASALMRLAEECQLHTLWVAPGGVLSHCDPEVFQDLEEHMWDVRYNQVPTSSARLARMKRMTAWRRGGTFDEKRMIEIIFPEQTAWEWEEEDPLTLLTAILMLQKEFAVRVDAHPGSVGRELMKWLVPQDHKVMPHVDLAQLPAKCGRDFAWKREITEPGTYLHAYDKNSMYLSAASGAGLGIGDPQYYCAENMKEPDLRLAGLWRVEVEPQSAQSYDPRAYPLRRFAHHLPSPLARGQEWCTTPVLKCLVEMGLHVKIYEGYEWGLTRRALGKWAEFLWKMRAHYAEDKSPAGQLCYFSLKRIATASVGLLASEKVPLKEKLWARPDWWSTVIETAKARVLYNIDHYGKEWRIWPVMIFVDCLYYVSDSPEPDKRLLARAKELGGYKHKMCVPITDQVREWFASEKKAGEIAELLNEVALEEVEHAH